MTLEVQSGCSLVKVFRFLLKYNLYLSIQPGWPDLCIGSLIASNVHGKILIDGNFLNIVKSFVIFHPLHGYLEVAEIKIEICFISQLGEWV